MGARYCNATSSRQTRSVNVQVARNLAVRSLAEERDRSGYRLIDHVARVAAAVAPEARTVAWLHELIEHGGATEETLRRAGLGEAEVMAVKFLTRRPDEPYDSHALSLAFAPGRAGELARTVKLADLDDHLTRGSPTTDAPPYAWARRHIALAQGAGARAPASPIPL